MDIDEILTDLPADPRAALLEIVKRIENTKQRVKTESEDKEYTRIGLMIMRNWSVEHDLISDVSTPGTIYEQYEILLGKIRKLRFDLLGPVYIHIWTL